jgi:hypothetical protein
MAMFRSLLLAGRYSWLLEVVILIILAQIRPVLIIATRSSISPLSELVDKQASFGRGAVHPQHQVEIAICLGRLNGEILDSPLFQYQPVLGTGLLKDPKRAITCRAANVITRRLADYFRHAVAVQVNESDTCIRGLVLRIRVTFEFRGQCVEEHRSLCRADPFRCADRITSFLRLFPIPLKPRRSLCGWLLSSRHEDEQH